MHLKPMLTLILRRWSASSSGRNKSQESVRKAVMSDFNLINLIVLIYIILMGNCSANGQGANSRSVELDLYLHSKLLFLPFSILEYHGAATLQSMS